MLTVSNVLHMPSTTVVVRSADLYEYSLHFYLYIHLEMYIMAYLMKSNLNEMTILTVFQWTGLNSV